jgi:hypothetical protein
MARRTRSGAILGKKGWTGDNGTQGKWTNFDDIVINRANGVSLVGTAPRYSLKVLIASTRGGDDEIDGASDSGPGIYVEKSMLLTGGGDDIISGGYIGVDDYDQYTSDVPDILINNAYISTDKGNDLIAGYSSSSGGGGIHLLKNGRIAMDEGNDSISIGGEYWSDAGLSLSSYSDIDMGSGNDSIYSQSDIIISGGAEVEMGDGADRLAIEESSEIRNSGKVFMGMNDDVLEGFGYGTGLFDGGGGSDLIRLPDGRYTIAVSGGVTTIYNEASQSMRTSGFETIGSLRNALTPAIGINLVSSGFVIGEGEVISLT